MANMKKIDKLYTQIPVSKIMSKNPHTISKGKTIKIATKYMVENRISSLLIVNKTHFPVGILTMGDIVSKVYYKKKDPAKLKVEDVMETNLKHIKPSLSIGEVSRFIKRNQISKLPVVANERLVGFVTRTDLIDELNKIYYQNRKLVWVGVLIAIQFVIIAGLISIILGL